VAEGKPMPTPTRYVDGFVPTYNHVVVLKVPPRPGVDDEELCRQFGRKVAQIVMDTANEKPADRERIAEARVRQMILTELPSAEMIALESEPSGDSQR
jgi:hypothetical protein